jgi:hypothetical protein
MSPTSPPKADHRGAQRAFPGRPSSGKAQLSLVAWVAAGDLDFRDWVLEGGRLAAVSRGSAWWLGDWLDYGTEKWGERYAKAARITGYDPKTLRNLRYVAAHVPRSLRRDELTWSHHALLASRDAEVQAYWLDRAVELRLTVDDLRLELRQARLDPKPAEGAAAPVVAAAAASDPVVAMTRDTGLLCPRCGYSVPHPATTQESPS